jgi:porphobilinogen deaminase
MGKELLLKGLVGNVESGSILRAESTGSISKPKALGELVANQLLDIGAGKLLKGV